MRFFEFGRVFHENKNEILENKKVAGLFFEKRQEVDFYECKKTLSEFFRIAGFEKSGIEWRKIDEKNVPDPWVMPYQSAEIFYHDVFLGSVNRITVVTKNSFLLV